MAKSQGSLPRSRDQEDLGEARQVPKASPTRTHSLRHGQEHVGVVLTLLQGVDALGLPLGPCLQEDGLGPQHT